MDPFLEGKFSDRPGDELLSDRLRVCKAIDKDSIDEIGVDVGSQEYDVFDPLGVDEV
jgi:hypothetical protein